MTYEDEAFDELEKKLQKQVAHGVTDSLWRKRQEPEALKRITRDDTEHDRHYYLADEVDALLAQPEQELVNEIQIVQGIPFFTPPQRTWVGLTDEEAFQICVDCGCLGEEWLTLLDAIEAKLKQKNGYAEE